MMYRFFTQAEALQTMLLEADNVHRPTLDTDHLQAEYGQDIVDFLLVSTSTRRHTAEDSLNEVVVSFRTFLSGFGIQ